MTNLFSVKIRCHDPDDEDSDYQEYDNGILDEDWDREEDWIDRDWDK